MIPRESSRAKLLIPVGTFLLVTLAVLWACLKSALAPDVPSASSLHGKPVAEVLASYRFQPDKNSEVNPADLVACRTTFASELAPLGSSFSLDDFCKCYWVQQHSMGDLNALPNDEMIAIVRTVFPVMRDRCACEQKAVPNFPNAETNFSSASCAH